MKQKFMLEVEICDDAFTVNELFCVEDSKVFKTDDLLTKVFNDFKSGLRGDNVMPTTAGANVIKKYLLNENINSSQKLMVIIAMSHVLKSMATMNNFVNKMSKLLLEGEDDGL